MAVIGQAGAYSRMLADEADWKACADALAPLVFELTRFLAEVLRVEAVPDRFEGAVIYQDSCSGPRGLDTRDEPRALLAKVPGLHQGW